jgi:Zn-dependent peptidase ImmA (M78 family)
MTFLIFQRCGIKKFPFDCLEILDDLGIKVIKYSELSKRKQEMCFKCSDSAFLFDFDIYYNDNESDQRIKFSLMHELGHIMLGHKEHTAENEKAANFFAKNMLAPPIAIHYAKTTIIKDIASLFDITLSFASNAIDYYKKWHNATLKAGMSQLDKGLYKHFYNEKLQRFIFAERACVFCGEPIYNQIEPICNICSVDFMRFNGNTDDDFKVSKLRNNWLYNNL